MERSYKISGFSWRGFLLYCWRAWSGYVLFAELAGGTLKFVSDLFGGLGNILVTLAGAAIGAFGAIQLLQVGTALAAFTVPAASTAFLQLMAVWEAVKASFTFGLSTVITLVAAVVGGFTAWYFGTKRVQTETEKLADIEARQQKAQEEWQKKQKAFNAERQAALRDQIQQRKRLNQL